MIITKIAGGLGNQMFQYAAGRSLAITHNCELKLDLSWFDTFKLHNGYELERFNIKAGIATKNEVVKLAGNQSKLIKALRKKMGFRSRAHFIESDFSFCPEFIQSVPPVLIEGHWQSYKYFDSVSSVICAELAPKSPLSDASLRVAEEISGVNAVSIHIRRGDYVSNKAINDVHGVIGLDYYTKAIQHVRDVIPSPHFFIFSDDLEWAKKTMGLESGTTFVSHNKALSSYQDMQLMAACKHNIIANSSFSWWGAWINPYSNKTVIAPRRWFSNRRDVLDLLPPSWLTL